MSARHDMNRLVRDALRAGLVLTPARHGHSKLTDPRSGRWVLISNNPRCEYAASNARKNVRRVLGVDV